MSKINTAAWQELPGDGKAFRYWVPCRWTWNTNALTLLSRSSVAYVLVLDGHPVPAEVAQTLDPCAYWTAIPLPLPLPAPVPVPLP